MLVEDLLIQEKENVVNVFVDRQFTDDSELCINWVLEYKDGSSVTIPVYWNTYWNSKMLNKNKDSKIIDMLYVWIEENEDMDVTIL
jgi:hypothetical protein